MKRNKGKMISLCFLAMLKFHPIKLWLFIANFVRGFPQLHHNEQQQGICCWSFPMEGKQQPFLSCALKILAHHSETQNMVNASRQCGE